MKIEDGFKICEVCGAEAPDGHVFTTGMCDVCWNETIDETEASHVTNPTNPSGEQCTHPSVNMGVLGDEGFTVTCRKCGEDLTPIPPKKEYQAAESRIRTLEKELEQYKDREATWNLFKDVAYKVGLRTIQHCLGCGKEDCDKCPCGTSLSLRNVRAESAEKELAEARKALEQIRQINASTDGGPIIMEGRRSMISDICQRFQSALKGEKEGKAENRVK